MFPPCSYLESYSRFFYEPVHNIGNYQTPEVENPYSRYDIVELLVAMITALLPAQPMSLNGVTVHGSRLPNSLPAMAKLMTTSVVP